MEQAYVIADQDANALRARLREVLRNHNFSEVAKVTGVSAETARRYCTCASPSVHFITAICRHWNINANWLLFGHAPMRGLDLRSHVQALLSESDQVEVFAAQLHPRRSLPNGHTNGNTGGHSGGHSGGHANGPSPGLSPIIVIVPARADTSPRNANGHGANGRTPNTHR